MKIDHDNTRTQHSARAKNDICAVSEPITVRFELPQQQARRNTETAARPFDGATDISSVTDTAEGHAC